MSLTRFETALPDTMTIEDAIRAMIEGDGRIKLPLCYDTIIGFPLLDHLAECCRILERRYESALEYCTQDSIEVARQQLDDMETIRRNAQLYRDDLNNLADAKTPEFSSDADLLEDGSLIPDHRNVLRSALVPWAYKTHGVDIHGFHARQAQPGNDSDPSVLEGLSIPDRSRPTMSEHHDWAKRNVASVEDLRRAVLGEEEQVRPIYSEGEKVFLSLAWLLDQLLTARNRDWRKIVTDETDETSAGFLIKGRLNISSIAGAVADQLPLREEVTDPAKTIKGHVQATEDFLMYGLDHALQFSEGQIRMAYRTMYGLARVTWKAKTGKPPTDRQTVEYPQDTLNELVDGLTGATPLTADELKGCLEEALLTTRRLYPAQEP